MKTLAICTPILGLGLSLWLRAQAPPESLLIAQFTNAPVAAATVGPNVAASAKTNVTSKTTNQMELTVGAGDDKKLLVAFIAWVDNTATRLTNINANGTNMTLLNPGTNFQTASANSNMVYYLIAPASGATKVWMRWNGAINEIASTVALVTNANQSTPFRTHARYSSGYDLVTGCTNTVTTAAYDLVLDQVMYYLEANLQPGSGQTVVVTSTNTGSTIESRLSKLIASGASTTTSWTNYDQAIEETYITVPIRP